MKTFAHRERRRASTCLALRVRVLSERRAVLGVVGRLDAVTSLPFKARLQELVREGRRELVCDLTRTRSLDSSGLAALLSGVRETGQRGGFLRLVVGTEQVARTFRRTGLDRVLELHASVEAALGPSAAGAGVRVLRVA